MARKRAERREMDTAEGPKLKPVRLDLPPDLHRLLRLAAAGADTSMASYARDILDRHLRGGPEGEGRR